MAELYENLNPTLASFLYQMSETNETMKRELNIDIPYVKLNWKVDELRKSINILCYWQQIFVKLGKLFLFHSRVVVVMKIFSHEGKMISLFGKGELDKGEFRCLTGIAIDDLCSIVTVDRDKY
ncbi:hypothetical protein LOD99_7733 [Oopsacas minuta]|uniref:Uncharacterized protein n=1 Tax=Oopsacas minuta TaxID=111878 RepID=A0AAV7JPB6_9METZ|nr:hypothetical protein LOD99_7733 [Oopsacas minuta]